MYLHSNSCWVRALVFWIITGCGFSLAKGLDHCSLFMKQKCINCTDRPNFNYFLLGQFTHPLEGSIH